MANTITFFRMAISIVLLFCPAFSPAFHVLYITAGLPDMLDGFVARKTDTASELGARLDWNNCLYKGCEYHFRICRTEEGCDCSFGYEQSDRSTAVSVPVDDPCCWAEIPCGYCLCGGNVRCYSGRPFYQNRRKALKVCQDMFGIELIRDYYGNVSVQVKTEVNI